MRCANKEGKAEVEATAKSMALAALAPKPGTAEELVELEQNENIRLNKALIRRRIRRSVGNAPEGLTGTAAEEWADAKMVSLLPGAVVEVEYQMENGTDEQRMAAAKMVLESTGRGKRENGTGSISPILLITGVELAQLPWAQPAKRLERTIDALPSTVEPA